MRSASSSLLPTIVALSAGWRFERLGLQCSVVTHARPAEWAPLYTDTRRETVRVVEAWFGRERERARHNARSLRSVFSRRRAIVTQFGGFSDAFVPIEIDRRIVAFLVCGPFVSEAPNAQSISRHWAALSRRAPSATDPKFLTYLRLVLDAVRLERGSARVLVELLETLAAVVNGAAARESLDAVHRRLLEEASELRSWDAAQGLVDRWTNSIWLADFMADERAAVGLTAVPTVVLAAVPEARGDRSEIEHQIVLDRFQRECVTFAQSMSNAVAGRLSSGGVFFALRTKSNRPRRVRTQMLEIAGTLRRRARREHALDLRVGVGVGQDQPTGLPASYDQALLALQFAMQAEPSVCFYEDIARHGGSVSLYASIRGLCAAVESGSSSAVAAGSERFLRDAMLAARGDRERMAAYLESTLYRVAEVLEKRDLFDARQFDDFLRELRESLDDARSIHELPKAFSARLNELAVSMAEPSRGRRDRKLERARRFIQKNFDRPLRRAEVAREAGLSPDYFSALFKEHTGETFEAQLLRLRVERGAELLRVTRLPIQQIAKAAGFNSYQHFFHAFQRSLRTTPLAYRRAAAKDHV